jgi:uncharacterized membrane protein YfcA
MQRSALLLDGCAAHRYLLVDITHQTFRHDGSHVTDTGTELALAACIFLGASLYSSVGHGGASAYIAIMALFGVAPGIMRPTALVLNIIVSGLGSVRYFREGMFRWRVLWPFLVTAVPMAFVGGGIALPSEVYKPLVGVVLWLSALRIFWPLELKGVSEAQDPPVVTGLVLGAAIGLLSGLTGTGGGIFLSPLLLLMAWSLPKQASGVVSIFILVNSASGLAGNYSSMNALPDSLPLLAGAAVAGAIAGTTLGIKLPGLTITRLLGVVLVIAGAKLIGLY